MSFRYRPMVVTLVLLGIAVMLLAFVVGVFIAVI